MESSLFIRNPGALLRSAIPAPERRRSHSQIPTGTLAVGAYGEDSTATGIGGNQGDNTAATAGAVYLY
ncbi:MAG: hypothetical protein OEW39_04790 [Deltaproteobacteria bacterium]|nr:hypothetical protein [Deltaproteobacteria bacterium]